MRIAERLLADASVEARLGGMAPRPAPGVVYRPSAGPSALRSVPPHLKRLAPQHTLVSDCPQLRLIAWQHAQDRPGQGQQPLQSGRTGFGARFRLVTDIRAWCSYGRNRRQRSLDWPHDEGRQCVAVRPVSRSYRIRQSE